MLATIKFSLSSRIISEYFGLFTIHKMVILHVAFYESKLQHYVGHKNILGAGNTGALHRRSHTMTHKCVAVGHQKMCYCHIVIKYRTQNIRVT